MVGERPTGNSCFGLKVISSLGAHLSCRLKNGMEDGEGIDSDKVCFTVRFQEALERTPTQHKNFYANLCGDQIHFRIKTIAGNPLADFVAGKENETE